MLNRYPLWKYIVIVLILLVGALYALPNFFGEDPALQVSGVRGTVLGQEELSSIRQELENKDIQIKSLELDEDQLLIRFKSTDTQLKARVAGTNLGDDYIVALNLPATPSWLQAIGAELKLGLDLRGGVHFDGSGHSAGLQTLQQGTGFS